MELILFRSHAVVDQYPADQAGPHLTEDFPVEYANSRVKLSPDEPVVDQVTRVSPQGQKSI